MEEPKTKRCSRCRQTLPLEDFSKRSNGRPQCYCKPCFLDYLKEHYNKNKESYFRKAKAREERYRKILREAKSKPCADCGKEYPFYVMDFDHRPGEKKLYNVSTLTGKRRVSLQALLDEIAKCDIVCANCHRERTWTRGKKKKSKYLINEQVVSEEAVSE